MKLLGHRRGPDRLIGVLAGDGTVVDVATVDAFFDDVAGGLATAAGLVDRSGTPSDRLRLVPPVPDRARVLCVGVNYRAHAAEGGNEVAPFPTIFGRWTASLVADGAPVAAPPDEAGFDWEGELAVVIGRELRGVAAAEALAGVLGYAPFNDLSARTRQRHTSQWTMGKNADSSGPIGAIVTADEVGDPNDDLRLRTSVDGEVVQDATTADMVYDVPTVIAYLTEAMTLRPGDVIATGTPAGVGYARRPPRFLVPGEVVTVEIDRVGRVATPIVAAT